MTNNEIIDIIKKASNKISERERKERIKNEDFFKKEQQKIANKINE